MGVNERRFSAASSGGNELALPRCKLACGSTGFVPARDDAVGNSRELRTTELGVTSATWRAADSTGVRSDESKLLLLSCVLPITTDFVQAMGTQID